MNQQWKPVFGYEGIYEVGDLGDIKSVKRNESLRPSAMIDRYYTTVLYKGGLKKYVNVHRIVASAWVPNPDGLPQVNHKDGNKLNNHVDNLEWCTAKKNKLHSMETLGRKAAFGINNGHAKIDNVGSIVIREAVKQGFKQIDIARYFKVSHGTVSNIALNKVWKHTLPSAPNN